MKKVNFRINNLFLNICGDIKVIDDEGNVLAKTDRVLFMQWSKNIRFSIHGENYTIRRVKIGLKQTIRKIFKDHDEIGQCINTRFPIKDLGSMNFSGSEYKILIKYEGAKPYISVESTSNISTIYSQVSPLFMFQNSKGVIKSNNDITKDDLAAFIVAIYFMYLAYSKTL